MRVLAVDTSSDLGSVCVVDNGEVLGEIRLACSIQHSERLFRSIEFIFRYLPFTLDGIDLFTSARGPGSFTGLRVGLAAMSGFAAANGKSGAGVSTLEALAWRSDLIDTPIAPMVDARRGEVYAAVYRRLGDALIEERPPEVIAPENWYASLPAGPLNFCGGGALRYRSGIVRTDRPEWKLHPMDLYLASTVAELGARPDCGPLEPLYIRRTEAELAREQHESVAGSNTKS